MRASAPARIAAALFVLAGVPAGAQEHAAAPAAPGKPASAAAPAKHAPPPARNPTALAPPSAAPSRGLVIAPSKPVVAPGINQQGDAGAVPAAARSANAKTISVSARQAAENTIAALVAAMKSMPKRPPAPPEPRTARARRAAGAAGAQAVDAPPPILYHVTWPAAPLEPGLGRRVELDWAGESTNGVRLRWNEPVSD